MKTDKQNISYDSNSIRTVTGLEYIQLRPNLHIGRTGDGSHPDDGIYVLLKEAIDNSVDEYRVGFGTNIDISYTDNKFCIQDNGRGIPLEKLLESVTVPNTSGKFGTDSTDSAYALSVGTHGLGQKIINALSMHFKIISTREGKSRELIFADGQLLSDNTTNSSNSTGVYVEYIPNDKYFQNFKYNMQYVIDRFWNYCYLNTGLTINFNGDTYISKNGLLDLLNKNIDLQSIRYDIVRLVDKNIEVAFTHDSHYGESYHSFVNGQYTNDGGTHQQAFREAFVKVIREFYKKQFDVQDIRASIVAAISIGIIEPSFESQTKNKLGSLEMSPGGVKIKKYFEDFLSVHLNEYLHKNKQVADALLSRIQQSERERKEISGIRKLANEKTKKANLCNRKLRDCKFHATDARNKHTTQLFIVEGDSAAGSFTSARDPQTQAVFSLKGKPLNVFGLTKKICYENDELNLLQHALGIEDGLDQLRYNDIVMATDADQDGLHIRLLLITFFAQFYPELIEHGKLYILITPLFRVRNNKKTLYCYDESEKDKAIKSLGGSPEITRFKGLGEISPEEFKGFITHKDIKLEQVPWYGTCTKTLEFFMGKNTQERIELIANHIKPEID